MSHSPDVVTYLNDGTPPSFYSKLLTTIAESKQARAPVKQWESMIDAFAQKGVKQIELAESGLKAWIATRDPSEVLTKESLLEEARRRYYTIKEVVLGAPKFPGYRQQGGEYREYLYIANSEKANIQDALEDVNWELEELNFYPERIGEDPTVVMRLEKRREALMRSEVQAVDFTAHHFSDRIEGKHGKNLLAHCRVSIHGDVYFIDEIQSDWAQRGRKSNWKGIPHGPLVTSTEAWAGMVMRRQMQIAAGMPGIKHFAWITESMRNGGRQNLEMERKKDEQRKAFRAFVAARMDERLAGIGAESMTKEQMANARELARPACEQEAHRAGLSEPRDMLNDFYLNVIPKLADKALGKSGAKVSTKKIILDKVVALGRYGSNVTDQPNEVEVPQVEMTPAVREALRQPQPMYSRAPLRQVPVDITREEASIALALKSAREMLGSDRHVRFASHVYDIASGRKVAGRYMNRIALVSLRAADLVEATEHECFHFAAENMMRDSEVEMLRREFTAGSELNFRVRTALTQRGMYEAAAQCDDPMDAAAHGFTLWKRGQVSMTERPVQGLFSDIAALVRDGMRWLRRVALEERATTVEELFGALARGELAAKEQLSQAEQAAQAAQAARESQAESPVRDEDERRSHLGQRFPSPA